MQATVRDNLLSRFYDNFELPFTGSIPEWLHKHVIFDDGKSFNIGICPWLNDIFAAIQDPSVEVVILEGAAGTYKTGVLDQILCWWVINDSGKVLRIHHRDEVAKDFVKTRVLPILENCKPVKALYGDKKITATNNLILFPHMDFKASGPSEKIQFGYSSKYLQIDEAQNIEEPFDNYFKRVRKNYGRTKVIVSSTPGETKYQNEKLIGDELAMLVKSGLVYRRAWKCEACEKYSLWHWAKKREDGTYSGINWGEPVLNADKTVDVERTSDNAKLECHHCKHQIDDKAEERIKLEKTARYELLESSAGGNKRIVTFQYPAWVAPHNSFKASCIQYMQAKELADAHLYDKLKEFYTQVAGEEWSNKIVRVKSKLTFVKYNSDNKWEAEKFRFMGVDLQGDGRRYYMIVAFDAVGNARVINYGLAHSWFEIEKLAIQYKVQLPTGENAHFVGIDCGYDWAEVAKETVRHGIDKAFEQNGQTWKEHFGWLCLRGDQKDFFNWDDDIKRVVSPQGWYDTGADSPPARYYFWSNKSVKNLVASIRDGHNKLKLEINTTDETLHRQLNSEYPDQNGDWKEKSKENHWWDCLNMCYTLGTLAGIPFYGSDTVVKS